MPQLITTYYYSEILYLYIIFILFIILNKNIINLDLFENIYIIS